MTNPQSALIPLTMLPANMTVAVSGVTGNLGGIVLRRLANIAEHGHVIGLVRDAARAPQRDGVEIRVADYADAASCEKALADVADVAIAVLRKPELQAGRTLELTGPEALSFAEVASRASAILGKPLTFVNETVDEAYASRAHYNAPQWKLDAWIRA